MSKGKAYGINWDYQKLCHDIIRELQAQQQLTPYKDNGVDVSFSICGTGVTFDAALTDREGDLVVIECKRYKKETKIEQRDVFAFWAEIEWLRRTLNVGVNGIFITGSGYRIGAIKAATALGIEVMVCEPDQTSKGFLLSYHHYDPVYGKTTGAIIHAVTAIAILPA
jgi:Restriction endonuclease